MKIRATVLVEVDKAEWATASGRERGEVRQDVIAYIRESLQSAPMFSQETAAEVTVK